MKKYCFILIICLISLAFQPAQAQQQQSMTEVVNRLIEIRASIDGLMNAAISYIFQTSPNVGKAAANNTAIKTAAEKLPPQIKKLNTTDIIIGLSPTDKGITERSVEYAQTIKASDSLQTGGELVTPAFVESTKSAMQSATIKGNENFDFQTLIDPEVYDEEGTKKALNFIRFAGGYGIPVSSFNLSAQKLTPKEKEQIQDSGDYRALTLLRRQLLAQQSTALSALYKMYAKRLPLEDIKKADTTLNKDKPSLAEIEKHVATWRTTDPKWYTQMATLSSANVGRETLFVLAEMQAQLYRLHQDNEQIIALLAINQLAVETNTKTAIKLAEKLVSDAIEEKIKGKTPPPVTAPQLPPQQKPPAPPPGTQPPAIP